MELRNIEFTVGQWGQIVDPDLHDSNLIGVRLQKFGSAELLIIGKESQVYQIQLIGVIRLRANEFREGNTILDVSILNGPEVNISLIAEVFGVAFETEKSKRYFQENIDKIIKKDLSILSLNPAYGCSLLALCTELKFFRVEKLTL